MGVSLLVVDNIDLYEALRPRRVNISCLLWFENIVMTDKVDKLKIH